MSDFAALNTALSALLAHRRVSEVLGQNVANVNTEGYSRQRVDLSSQAGSVVPAVFSRSAGVGNGVKIDSLIRLRDDFLEKRSLVENGASASLTRQVEVLRRVEMSFKEPADTSLATQLADFWAAWDDVGNKPDGIGARTQLLERATTVANAFNRSSTELTQLRDSANSQIVAIVAEVNAHASRIAELNDAIRQANAADLNANDLADQRDRLVQRVAKLTGATARDGEFGMVDVVLGGSALVRGITSEELQVVTDAPAPPGSASRDVGWNQTGLRWTKDRYPVLTTGGEVNGFLTGINETIPKYLNQLNTTARTLAEQVNSVHATGYDLNGTAGTALFTYFGNPTPPPPPAAATGWAQNLTLGFRDPRLVAASADATRPLDGSVAQELARRVTDPDGADASYRAIVSALGVESQTMQRRNDIQAEVARQVDVERKSTSGVNLDEEMIQLTMTQHAYSAAARVMTTVDSLLETLINMAR